MRVTTSSKQDLINWDVIYPMVSCYLERPGHPREWITHPLVPTEPVNEQHEPTQLERFCSSAAAELEIRLLISGR